MARKAPSPPKESMLLLEEYLSAGDPRLIDELLPVRLEKSGATIAKRWLKDQRTEQRSLLFKYIADGCDRPGHRLLVKKLFKRAEELKDDELMAHFMVAIDRMIRRKVAQVQVRRGKQSVTTFVLEYENSMPHTSSAATRKSRFSKRTRQYLERRVFRYFRSIGRTDPQRYIRAMKLVLPMYKDESFTRPEHLLAAWGLVHVLYWGSPVLERNPKGIELVAGRTLGELEVAPWNPDAWRAVSIDEFVTLIETCEAQVVRTAVFSMLCKMHEKSLQSLAIPSLRKLLRSQVEELQTLGAELLRAHPGIATLPIQVWLELLETSTTNAQVIIAELATEHVHPNRLTLGQCIELASSRAAPIAQLGLAWTLEKFKQQEHDAGDISLLMHLANAQCTSVRSEAVQWLVSLLTHSAHSTVRHVRDLLDSRYEDVRAHALTLSCAERFLADAPLLWAAMSESPYPAVRAHLIQRLGPWKSASAEAMKHLWATVLLTVHTGGAVKKTTVQQIVQAIATHPEQAPMLLPLVAIALRSIRKPERKTGLAAITRLVFEHPSMRQIVEESIPELRLFAPEAA